MPEQAGELLVIPGREGPAAQAGGVSHHPAPGGVREAAEVFRPQAAGNVGVPDLVAAHNPAAVGEVFQPGGEADSPLSGLQQIFPPEPPHVGPPQTESPLLGQVHPQAIDRAADALHRTARRHIGNQPVAARHIGRRVGNELRPYAAPAQKMLQAVGLKHGAEVIRAVEGQDPHVCAVVLHGSLLNKGFVLGRLYPPARKKSTGTQFPS